MTFASCFGRTKFGKLRCLSRKKIKRSKYFSFLSDCADFRSIIFQAFPCFFASRKEGVERIGTVRWSGFRWDIFCNATRQQMATDLSSTTHRIVSFGFRTLRRQVHLFRFPSGAKCNRCEFRSFSRTRIKALL